MLTLQKLLGNVSKEHFSAEYLHRLPFAQANTASEFTSLVTWDVVGRILDEPADRMVVRAGMRLAEDPQKLEDAERLCEQGCTLLIRHAEQHDSRLKQIASSFQHEFHAPINIHLYVTPPVTHGFSWHYDAEDVFIIQTAGVKEYSLRKNTVNPWPLVGTIPQDMRYEREAMPLMRTELRAGDWLYIPCGYWHKADALAGDEAAMSLAVGVMALAAIDLLEFLRPRMLSSLLWRQRLPTTGDASPLTDNERAAETRKICTMLAEDLASMLGGEQIAEQFMDWRYRTYTATSSG